MSINSISQPIQSKVLSNLNNTSSSTNTNPSFAAALEEMLQNTSANNPANTILNNVTSSNNTLNGVNSLSLQPQNVLQIMQMLSSQNTSSNSSNNDIDDDSDDSSSDIDISSALGGTSDMSQLIDFMLQSLAESQNNNNTYSQNSNSPNSSDKTNIQNAINNLK